MAEQLCISIRFLDGAFHGRADHGEPEWPPSPLRLYQAIVAASAARWNERRCLRHAEPALKWLEQLPPPVIVAPAAREAQPYRLYVPDNAGDLVGRSWSKGGGDSIANYRTEKSVRPMLFQAEGAVSYLWSLSQLPEGFQQHREVIFEAVHAITHIGWGVDLVVADIVMMSSEDVPALAGQRWLPVQDSAGTSLRTPRSGTLDDLSRRHEAFLNRVNEDGFSPVPPLSVFDVTAYASDAEPPRAQVAIFALKRADDDSTYRSFEVARRGLHVAGMLRHAASRPEVTRSIGWSDDQVRQIVLGHGETPGDSHKAFDGARLGFIPLPSIEWRGEQRGRMVGSVRRVLITVRGSLSSESFRMLTQRLHGDELIDEQSKEPTALLQRQKLDDSAISPYLETSATWATVTPVILPGYDDPRKLRQRLRAGAETMTADEKSDVLRRLDDRIDALLRKALRQSGFSEAMVTHAEIDWRSTGFWPGTEAATQYAVPEQHRRYRRLHVKITWRSPDGQLLKVPGPLCIGGGKFSGMGLFAALP
ncbi:MAG: type I-G CRISPR-associated protein Csb2 [Prosthecobacter sp.]